MFYVQEGFTYRNFLMDVLANAVRQRNMLRQCRLFIAGTR